MKKAGHKKIIFTGGGSAGHVTPNLVLIKKCLLNKWQVAYIGSRGGIEKSVIKEFCALIPYYAIITGKLRRYFSWHNFLAPFKILCGFLQAIYICGRFKPTVVFAKGGFVSLPVVVAAWLNRIPVIIHESDLTPGLANRVSFPFAKKVCLSFPKTRQYFTSNTKVVITGTPIREDLFTGNAMHGLEICNFTDSKKVILVMGGGLGSEMINKAIRQILPTLLSKFQVVHLCGKGKTDPSIDLPGYRQFEYLHTEFADILQCANLVISRAGANAIWELVILQKPHILIPLAKGASRGDQLANAEYFSKLNYSKVVYEEEVSTEKLLAAILWLDANEKAILTRLKGYKKTAGNAAIYDIINSFLE